MDEWQKNFLQGSPMFEPLRVAGGQIEKLDRWPTLAELNVLLPSSVRTENGTAIHFAPQGPKPCRMEDKYEARIYLRGEVQTRTENWHDLFNALVWLAFPHTKAAINAKHFEAISQRGEGNRGKEQDALTLFDESGVMVLYAEDELAELIKGFRWRELFWERRRVASEKMKFVLFGHSLYEKALKPYIGFTGKGFLVGVGPEVLAQPIGELDALLAERLLQGETLTSLDLSPVPLLGVPDWWEGNERPEFYDNTAYFRPQKNRIRTSMPGKPWDMHVQAQLFAFPGIKEL